MAMCRHLGPNDRLGLIHSSLDAHTLGVSSIEQLVRQCGLRAIVAEQEVRDSIAQGEEFASVRVLKDWIQGKGITALGFSYRLDPEDGARLFDRLVERLHKAHLLAADGGTVGALYFAGLPSACDLVLERHPRIDGVFRGDETLLESLNILGIPHHDLPTLLSAEAAYDEARMTFGRELIRSGAHHAIAPVKRTYPRFGERGDSLLARIAHGEAMGLPPLMRAHVGPYLPDRKEAVALFLDWTRRLATSGLLDVLSIGTSQLTQEAFGEKWGDRPNGGGVPLNSTRELAEVWEAARPMLVRIYAGTTRLERMAWIYEETLDIAWHALSFWWFCQLDGRGPNPVRENLQEHLAVLRYIATTGKPFEPNVPHHFAFRGCDDTGYVVSGYLAARAAKEAGVRTLVLQVMLNTPKYTWGVQDLAKARALLKLVRGLEGPSFRVLLQPRGGLDYFSRDEEKAKVQLAAVTAMMDDIEPDNPASPSIIHVVSYSEATRLADPPVVDESIRITRHALSEYRRLRKAGHMPDMGRDLEVSARTEWLMEEASTLLHAIEVAVPDPCSAKGLYDILASGYLPLPYLWACRKEFPEATAWSTRLVDGGMRTVDAEGQPLSARERVATIAEKTSHVR